MQRVLFVKMSPEMKEKFHNNLSNKIKSTVAEVTMQDKMNLQNSLKSFKITENDQTLYFINKFIAKLLQRSAHSILKELGEKCVNFFDAKNEPNVKYVNNSRGRVVSPSFSNLAYATFGAETYSGYGVWISSQKTWSLVMTKSGVYGNTPLMSHLAKLSTIDPSQFSLITPLHVATLIGDKNLMEELNKNGIKNGMNFDEHLKFTPLEMAVMVDNNEIIDFLLSKKVKHNLDKALLCAVQGASFSTIEKLIKYGSPITDEVISAARLRDEELASYLDQCRKEELANVAQASPLTALQQLLLIPVIPMQLIKDLIYQYPSLLHTEKTKEGDLALHWAIKTGNLPLVKSLIEAIFESMLMKVPNLIFDINAKNLAGKTALMLALDRENNEMAAAIRIYFNPKTDDIPQEKLLKLNSPAIRQEKDTMNFDILCKLYHANQNLNAALINTNLALKNEEARNDTLLTHIRTQSHQLELQSQQIQLLTQQAIMQQQLLNHLLGLPVNDVRENIAINNNINGNQRLLLPPQANNRNILFAPQNLNEPQVVQQQVQQRNVLGGGQQL